jgi:hypothetical protein
MVAQCLSHLNHKVIVLPKLFYAHNARCERCCRLHPLLLAHAAAAKHQSPRPLKKGRSTVPPVVWTNLDRILL